MNGMTWWHYALGGTIVGLAVIGITSMFVDLLSPPPRNDRPPWHPPVD